MLAADVQDAVFLVTVNQGSITTFMNVPRATFRCQVRFNDRFFLIAKSYNNPPPDVTNSLLKLVTVLVFCLLLSFSIFCQGGLNIYSANNQSVKKFI